VPGILLPGVVGVRPAALVDQRVDGDRAATQRRDEIEVGPVEVVPLRGGHEDGREPAVQPLDRGHEPGRGAQHEAAAPLRQQHPQKIEAQHEAALEHHRDVRDAAVLHKAAQVFRFDLRADAVVGSQPGFVGGGGQERGDVPAGRVAAEHDPGRVAAEAVDVAGHPVEHLVGVLEHVLELEVGGHPVVRVDHDHAVGGLARAVLGQRRLVARCPAAAVEVDVDRERFGLVVRHHHVEAMVTDAVAGVVEVEVVVDGVDRLRVELVQFAGQDAVHQCPPDPDRNPGERGLLVRFRLLRCSPWCGGCGGCVGADCWRWPRHARERWVWITRRLYDARP